MTPTEEMPADTTPEVESIGNAWAAATPLPVGRAETGENRGVTTLVRTLPARPGAFKRGKMASNGTHLEPEAPQNLDAEQGLLASCLLDNGRDIVTQCLAAGVKASYFYRPAHELIYEGLVGLHADNIEPGPLVLANWLDARGKLEAADGHAYIFGLTERVATSVHAAHWLAEVINAHRKRQLLRAARLTIEAVQNEVESDGALEIAKREFAAIENEAAHTLPRPRGLIDFGDLEEINPDNILGDDWLEYGGILLGVSLTGQGKGTFSIQAAVEWSLARPFLGIRPAKPLKSLILQWEDSDRYVKKCRVGVIQGLGLNEAEQKIVNESVVVQNMKGIGGEKFFTMLTALVDAVKPDLVWINPMMNPIEGSVSDDKVAAPWLNALDLAMKGRRFATILIHHTGKPAKQDGSAAKKEAASDEFRNLYCGFGSSRIANHVRAGFGIEPRPGLPGQFYLHLGKNGYAAGVTTEVEHGVGMRSVPCLKIPIQHTKRELALPYGRRPMWLWEPSDEEVPASEQPKIRGAKLKYADDTLLQFYPNTRATAEPFGLIHNKMKGIGISDRTLARRNHELINAGLVICCTDAKQQSLYYRTQ